MKKLSRYRVGVISKNLEKVFDQCTKEEYANGKEWYYKTNRLITSMADTHGVDVLTATQVMSALSPRNRWEQNIKDAGYQVFLYDPVGTKLEFNFANEHVTDAAPLGITADTNLR